MSLRVKLSGVSVISRFFCLLSLCERKRDVNQPVAHSICLERVVPVSEPRNHEAPIVHGDRLPLRFKDRNLHAGKWLAAEADNLAANLRCKQRARKKGTRCGKDQKESKDDGAFPISAHAEEARSALRRHLHGESARFLFLCRSIDADADS